MAIKIIGDKCNIVLIISTKILYHLIDFHSRFVGDCSYHIAALSEHNDNVSIEINIIDAFIDCGVKVKLLLKRVYLL
jgi:hypothetical protein